MKLYVKERSKFDRKVAQAHDEILDELTTNGTGHIGRRYKKLAEDLADVDLFQTFPLDCYLSPATSPPDNPEQGWPGFGKGDPSSGRGRSRNMGRGDLEGMARACERYFEWGTREIVCKKFASEAVNLFGAEIVAEARGIARAMAPATWSRPTLRPGASPDRITSYFSQSTISTVQGQKNMSTTSARHLVKIHSTRPSPMSSRITEYRVQYRTKPYIDRCREAMDGTRADPSTLSTEERAALGMVSEATTGADTTVKDEVRVWVADYLVRAAWPNLIAKYEEEEAAKAAKKAAPKKKKAAAAAASQTAAGTGRKKAPAKVGENRDAFEEYFVHAPATQSAVREVERVTASQIQRSRASSRSSASSELPPSPSSPASSRSSSVLSYVLSSPIEVPSSPILVPSALPSPPLSPSKRGRPRSTLPSSRGSSPCPSGASTPLTSRRRSPRKKRATPPRTTPPRTTREPSIARGPGTQAEPILLLSSDDETTPRPLRPSATVAANTLPSPTPAARQTTISPPSKRGGRTGTGRSAAASTSTVSAPTRSKLISATILSTSPTAPARTITTSIATSKTTPTQSTQSCLDSLIVARARKLQPKVVAKDGLAPNPKVPYFVVSEDEDGVEHIDLTQRRKRT